MQRSILADFAHKRGIILFLLGNMISAAPRIGLPADQSNSSVVTAWLKLIETPPLSSPQAEVCAQALADQSNTGPLPDDR